MLSVAEQRYRVGKFTGSLANAVMNSTSELALNRVWREKVGLDPPMESTYAMEAGSHMEPFILDWLERHTGAITRRGEIVDHPTHPDICVKLDGYRSTDDAIIEVKFLAPYRNKEEFLPAYYAQTMLQRLCTGSKNAVLLVAQGTSEPIEYELLFDQAYADELMRRAELFLESMRTLTPPFPEPPIIPREKWRTVDIMREDTNWGVDLLDHLTVYGETAEAATMHDEAGKAAKALVPDDVGKCLAGIWHITRDRRGALRITRKV